MKKATFILFFIFIGFFSIAQRQIGVGLKVVSTYELNKYEDQGNLIVGNFPERIGSLAYGISFEGQLQNNLFCEIAVNKKNYWMGYEKNPYLKSISSASYLFTSFQIPILLKYKLKLHKFVFISPNIGPVFCTNQQYGAYHESSNNDFENIIKISYKNDFAKRFILGQFGLDLELNFTEKFGLVINSAILQGNKKVVVGNILYKLKNATGWNTAKITNNGNYWFIGLSMKYNFLY